MSEDKKNIKRPTAAILIIGDEILSGRTLDTNSNYLAGVLTAHGISLMQIKIIPDDKSIIISTVNELRTNHTYVFTSGGIGPTHDDITAEAIAAAFSVPLKIDSRAVALLASHYPNGEADLNTARLRMCRIPEGADLILNPISKAPGFSKGNVFVMAGVPTIFKAMVDSLAPKLTGGEPLLSISLRIDKGEGDIAEQLSKIAEKHQGVSIGSYPFSQNGNYGTMIVVRHTSKKVLEKLKDELLTLTKK